MKYAGVIRQPKCSKQGRKMAAKHMSYFTQLSVCLNKKESHFTRQASKKKPDKSTMYTDFFPPFFLCLAWF